MDLRNIVNNDEDSGSIFSTHSSPIREKQGSLSSAASASDSGRKDSLGKPRRYDTVPIWAQTWHPNHKANGGLKTPPAAAYDAGMPPKTPAGPPVRPGSAAGGATGPGGYPSLLGLTSSLTGVIPADDVTTKICSWLYSHLFQLEDQRQYIELEFKMGVILDFNSRQRARFPCITETVIAPDYAKDKLTFEATLDSAQFSRVESFITGLGGRTGAATLTKLPDLRQRDVIHPQQGSGANVRVSYDENNNMVDRIVKKRVGDLLIHSPGDLTDWRISLSTETPYTGPMESLDRPSKIRNKNRQSWQTPGLQVDLTGVVGDGGNSSKSKEVELEMDQKMILQFFDDFQSKKDPQSMDKFQELIRYGMDSCRTISRFISR